MDVGSPAALKRRLDALVAGTDLEARVARDPLRFVRRHRRPEDIEVAAVVASALAFGRVDLFGPVLDRIFAEMDRGGGPRAWIAAFDPRQPLPLLRYRWLTSEDFVTLFTMLHRALAARPTLAEHFPAGPLQASLSTGIRALRAHAPEGSRAFRTLLPDPLEGSACKRWCMAMRWLVRPEAPDLGIWTHLSPRDLVIPLDTHVFRTARFVGLTDRATPGWATAEAITASLRRFAPDDPTRYDFALAHLGISGACRGHRDAEVCPTCPLDPLCGAPAKAATAPRAPRKPRL